MTAVRIAHAEPWPGRLREGGFAITEFLVVLAGEDGDRALPLWLPGADGDALWQVLGQPPDGAGTAGVAEELAARILGAAGVSVTGVDIDELAAEVTAPPRRDWRGKQPPGAAARISLHGPGGTRQVTARLGYGLALAAAAGPPDYACTTGDQRAVLASAVPEPRGRAALVQMIAADDYRGATVTFRAELRIDEVADRAGLFLVAGPADGPVPRPAPAAPRRVQVTVAGSRDWTRHEVTVEVPGDAGIIRFGMFLSGPGRAELRGPDLLRSPGNVAAPSGH